MSWNPGEGVDAVFVNTFASYHLPHRADPRQDLDRASYGVVKVLEGDDGPGREAKVAFAALANLYRTAGQPASGRLGFQDVVDFDRGRGPRRAEHQEHDPEPRNHAGGGNPEPQLVAPRQ